VQKKYCGSSLSLAAKREQRSVKAKSPSAALSDVRLCGHASGFDV
jgi:hypothetical protein